MAVSAAASVSVFTEKLRLDFLFSGFLFLGITSCGPHILQLIGLSIHNNAINI